MAEFISIRGAREHPGNKIFIFRNLIADCFISGFATGQVT